MIDFNNDDNRLEVKDKQGHIAFSVKYLGANSVFIAGYYITPTTVMVLSNCKEGCPTTGASSIIQRSRPAWLTEALQAISSIRTIF
jgi:hypothetical protein